MRVLAIMVAVLALTGCGPSPSSKPAGPSVQEPEIPLDGPPNGAWRYSSSTDEMSGYVTEVACVNAEQLLEAKPPYTTARPELCLTRSKSDVPMATVKLHGAGRIDCNLCGVRVKLEGGKVETAVGGEHHGEKVDYIELWDRTVSRLVAKGGILWVEVPLTDDMPIIRFKVRGAPWPEDAVGDRATAKGAKPAR